jgi:hypothetical protein
MLTLSDLALAVRRKQYLESEVLKHDAQIKELKGQIQAIEEETLPCAFQELGIEKIKMEDGSVVSIGQEVYSGLTEATKPAAFKWLVNNNFGGLIKTEIKINYSKDEEEQARKDYQALINKGCDAGIKQDVHHQTLKSFLKERLQSGEQFPLELFLARPIFKAKIRNPK